MVQVRAPLCLRRQTCEIEECEPERKPEEGEVRKNAGDRIEGWETYCLAEEFSRRNSRF